MQFGWLTLSLSPSGDEDAARIDQQIEQVCYAEELGFSDVWLTEHYFTGESVYNDAVVFAAALAIVIWLKHAGNIKRLLTGQESRIGKKS